MNIVWTVFSIALLTMIYIVPVLILLFIIKKFMSNRVTNWDISSRKAIINIATIVFFPIIFILFLLVIFSFAYTDGNISWLGELKSTSIRDEAAWHVFILLGLTWPFFLFYGIGGIFLTVNLYKKYKNK